MSTGYQVIDGFRCYAPQVALQGENYPLDAFDVTAEVESRSFWCRSRNRIVRDVFQRFADHSRPLDVLEIGCGIGGVVGELRRIPNLRLTGSEVYLRGLRYARSRFPEIEFIQLDASAMPFRAEFDLIGAFDVLEHIEKDVQVVAGVFEALRPGGLFVITVPQHPWMWGRLDEIVHHKRRYTRRDLVNKLKAVGFQVLTVSSFVTVLFPFMLASRLLDRARSSPAQDAKAEFAARVNLPGPVNTLFDVFMRIDEAAIRARLSLPFGGSLLAVTRRPS
jgi:SAM-dependent methyltransferase